MRRSRHVVVSFRVDPWGNARPLRAVERPTADDARRYAKLVAAFEAGSIAFSRTGDPEAGRYEGDAELLAAHGDVDLGALVRQR